MAGNTSETDLLLSAETNCSNPDNLTAAEYEDCFISEFQGTYWVFAAIMSSISLLGLLRLAYEAKVNKKMREKPITYFYVMLTGDLIFVGTYLPYHLNNVVLLNFQGYVDVDADVLFCKTTWFTAVTSILLELFGLVLISYYPYKVMMQSKEMRRKKENMMKTNALCVAGALFCAAIWFISGIVLDQVGSYRGLYCGARTWANLQGVILFFYPSVAFTFMCFFYYKAYKAMKAAALGSDKTGDRKVRKAAERVMKFGLLMVSSFFLTWGPLTIASFFNVVGIRLPIQFEMFAGLMTKTKGFVDMCVMLQMPQLKRRKVGSASSSMAPGTTQGTAHSTNASSHVKSDA